jgi:hypothetical protein
LVRRREEGGRENKQASENGQASDSVCEAGRGAHRRFNRRTNSSRARRII